jgi:hypothetical protein
VISPQNGIKIVKIGYHKNGKANFVKVLNENMIISGGDENIIFYDSGYNNKKEILIKNDNIFKIKENKKNNNMEIIICSDKVDKINLLSIPNNISNLDDYKIRTIEDKMKTRICFNFNKDFILCNEKGLFQKNDLISNITKLDAFKIPNINKSYWTGIKINSELIAITSNKNLLDGNGGEDKIIFYNYYAKKIIEFVENYSFALSQNNLALMPIEVDIYTKDINKSNKVLLCACKKYKEDQKNGILLLNLDLNDNNNLKVLSQTFYEIEYFEIYCLCPLFKLDNNHILDVKKTKLIETDRFLVGGFNTNTNQGLIKLYKVNNDKDNFEKTEIEYIKDIEIKEIIKKAEVNFVGFKGYITYINQSRYDGKILLTCSDGNVYSLEYDEYFFD